MYFVNISWGSIQYSENGTYDLQSHINRSHFISCYVIQDGKWSPPTGQDVSFLSLMNCIASTEYSPYEKYRKRTKPMKQHVGQLWKEASSPADRKWQWRAKTKCNAGGGAASLKAQYALKIQQIIKDWWSVDTRNINCEGESKC